MLYKPHALFEARLEMIGNDRAPVLVIDNFCSDPDSLVMAAEDAFARGNRQRASFPGIVTAADEGFARSSLAFLMPTLCSAFDVSGRVQNGGFDFQLITSRPEDLSPRQTKPHYDVADMDVIASVLFLCRPPFLGTSFYRHDATGFEVITPDRVSAFEQAIASEAETSRAQGYLKGDSPGFTEIAHFGVAYNRMILFSAASLHAGTAVPAHGFSAAPREGRLTANLFLKFAR